MATSPSKAATVEAVPETGVPSQQVPPPGQGAQTPQQVPVPQGGQGPLPEAAAAGNGAVTAATTGIATAALPHFSKKARRDRPLCSGPINPCSAR